MTEKIKLAVIQGSERNSFVIEDGQTLLVGRGEQSDTAIQDRALSRVHFKLMRSGNRISLEDVGSRSGTFLNGEQVQSTDCKPGDKIKAGNTLFALLSGQQPAQQVNVSIAELSGRQFGNYLLGDVIALGRSGVVFKAQDQVLDRTAAVKVLRPQFAGDEEKRERFVRAMKTMHTVKDNHIVELYAAGKTGKFCWAAMEFIEGESLFDLIKRLGPGGMLPWAEGWRAAVHVTRALQAAYYQSIIHRNVTPTNIIRRTSDQLCKLGDFMVAKAIDGSLAFDVTSPGQIVGDLKYLPPERIQSTGSIDTRSDIYGLGATCYALLTGRTPVGGKTVVQIVENIVNDEPKPPTDFNSEVNPRFSSVVLKMLAKTPGERFNTPNVLLKELEEIGRSCRLETDLTGYWGA